ncbi:MAG: type I DNA topoisomerase [bacterium]|nr:type I DNA topoisomerase [bacterium]
MSNLVIVESPAKAKLIQKFLGKGYTVKASMGHIRDLPDKKTELSPSQQKLSYASLAIDVDHDFAPLYVIKDGKRKVVQDLKAEMKNGPQVWIATDEDREGEAIGYHLAHILKLDPKTTKRIVFHEITKKAILEAMEHPRVVDVRLFDAQQARRILDRLVGYKLSPLLWTKIRYGLSAGRVQSVAVRIVVEREREIQAFGADEFWKLTSVYADPQFEAELSAVNGDKLDHKKSKVGSAQEMSKILDGLKGQEHRITDIEQKDTSSSPSAPFTTSTLQQEASTKLGFGVKQTMMVAQRLYEGNVKKKGFDGGFITYMRTDSVTLSDQALAKARDVITKEYGKTYALDSPRIFKGKSKNAQEAHEAIRPTDLSLRPKDAEQYLDDQQLRLYSLIWKRTIASQMAPAQLKKTTVTISAGPHQFTAEGQVIVFPGYMKVYESASKERILPALEKGQLLHMANILQEQPTETTVLSQAAKAEREEYEMGDEMNLSGAQQKKLEQLQAAYAIEPKIPGLIPSQHFTKPPARYTEASLVKKLESLGIGRPSTYAPTINTIQVRNYVEKKEDKRLHPTDVGMVVNDFLVRHFHDILSYDFTARVEDQLDEVAEGKVDWVDMIRSFFSPFQQVLEEKKESIKRDEVITQKTDVVCEDCGKPMEIKLGRFGKFLSCTGFPACKAARPINPDGTPGEIVKPTPTGEKCPDCGEDLIHRQGRFGKFVGCSGYPKCKYIQKNEKLIGVSCVACEGGEIVEKKTRRGKIFYGCNKYPDCKSAFWDLPVAGKTCPVCGPKQLMVQKKPKKGQAEGELVCPVCSKPKRKEKV